MTRPHHLLSARARRGWRSCVRQCIVEVFVFLKVGGAAERLTVIPIGEGYHDIRTVYTQLMHFDLREAQCYLPADREKLLSCIARGFGEDAHAFNVAVRRLIRSSIEAPTISREASPRAKQTTAPIVPIAHWK